jgi:hypothetical protein
MGLSMTRMGSRLAFTPLNSTCSSQGRTHQAFNLHMHHAGTHKGCLKLIHEDSSLGHSSARLMILFNTLMQMTWKAATGCVAQLSHPPRHLPSTTCRAANAQHQQVLAATHHSTAGLAAGVHASHLRLLAVLCLCSDIQRVGNAAAGGVGGLSLRHRRSHTAPAGQADSSSSSRGLAQALLSASG